MMRLEQLLPSSVQSNIVQRLTGRSAVHFPAFFMAGWTCVTLAGKICCRVLHSSRFILSNSRSSNNAISCAPGLDQTQPAHSAYSPESRLPFPQQTSQSNIGTHFWYYICSLIVLYLSTFRYHSFRVLNFMYHIQLHSPGQFLDYKEFVLCILECIFHNFS